MNAISFTVAVAIVVLTDTSDDECTIAKFKKWALQCTHSAVGIRSLILAWIPVWIPNMFAAPLYPCTLILSITMPKFSRVVQNSSARFSLVVLLALTKQEISHEGWLYHQYILQFLYTQRLVHVLKHQLLHRQRKQSIQSFHAITIFSYHFIANIDYFVLYIWRCVFYSRIRERPGWLNELGRWI